MKQKLFRTANLFGRGIGHFALTFISQLVVLALPLMLVAFPTLGIAQPCIYTPVPLPGKVYPLFQWRLANGGRLPQTFTYPMEEDTITMTIEDGASRGIGPNAMMIVLTSAPSITWRKEIAAWHSRLGQTTTIATQDGNHGPISMILTPKDCFGGAETIIFRKEVFGWRMWDMYHLDIATFWRVLAGKVVTFNWTIDDPGNIFDPYPMPCSTPCLPVGSRPTNWDSLGGGLSGNIAVGQNNEGHLQVFVHGNDNALHTTWQLSLSPGGAWAGWSTLYGGLIGSPAVVRNAYNRLQVFVRGTDNMLWYRRQSLSGWYAWTPLGGAMASDPVVGQNADGRLEVFWRGADGALHHKWELPGGGWSDGVASLGGGLIGNPAVVRNSQGCLEVFVHGTDHVPYRYRQLSAGSNSWSIPTSLTMPPGEKMIGSPAVGRNIDGSLVLFVRWTDSSLYHKSQFVPGGDWDDWEPLGGKMTSDPVVGENLDGALQVFVRGTDSGLYFNKQTSAGGHWSGWSGLGVGLIGNPAVGRNADGRLELFMLGDDGELHHNWQVTPGGNWFRQ